MSAALQGRRGPRRRTSSPRCPRSPGFVRGTLVSTKAITCIGTPRLPRCRQTNRETTRPGPCRSHTSRTLIAQPGRRLRQAGREEVRGHDYFALGGLCGLVQIRRVAAGLRESNSKGSKTSRGGTDRRFMNSSKATSGDRVRCTAAESRCAPAGDRPKTTAAVRIHHPPPLQASGIEAF